MAKNKSDTFQPRSELVPPLWILTLLTVALFIWLLFVLKELVVLLVVGYSLAYAIEPVIVKLQQRGVSRVRGFFLVGGTSIVFILILLLTAVPTLLSEGQQLIENFPEYVTTVQQKIEPIVEKFAQDPDHPLHEFVSSPFETAKKFSSTILPRLFSAIGQVLLSGYSVTLTLLNIALLPFIVFYLSVDFPTISKGFYKLLPHKRRRAVEQVAVEIDGYVSAFVRGQILVCSILFLLYAMGLGVLGIKLWLVLAVIAGFGNMIPYVGTMLGIVLASILAVVTFGDLWHVLYVWIWFGTVQFLEGTFITPNIIGESVGLSPLVVILAIVAGGSLFGLLGIFLAVPCAAALKVLLRRGHAWVIAQ